MMRNSVRAEKDESLVAQHGYFKKDASSKLIRFIVFLMVFIGGILTGLVSTSQRSTLSFDNYYKIYKESFQNNSTDCNVIQQKDKKCGQIDYLSIRKYSSSKQT